ncbi:hypothetical protein AMS68_007933 [Peltaster fructicola]|uniref:F-box domain-containing protein n=1 Tax=Peltaster fructicola TaxID=286661 RepID=A0A6H0Y604_9PEZI|nr:hypothetical protein AMS68_007933 [Peltaster fructicola]
MASASKRRSTRQMASRKRSQYIDPETEDELMTPSEYDSDVELPRELDDSPRPSKRQRTVTPRPQRNTQSKSTAKGKAKAARPQRRREKVKIVVVGRPKRARAKDAAEHRSFAGPSDGVIPAWTTLPADVLRDIFFFGSQPLTRDNVTWLLGAARTCRAFAEPALEALYYWPSIWSPLHLHRLLELLQKREGRLMNYNRKVKRLDVDIRRLAYAAHNRPLFNLGDLLAKLPSLQHLEIVHPIDEPPYRELRIQAWQYQAPIFSSLESSHIRLTAWRWTRDMLKYRNGGVYTFMEHVHQSPAFATVRELVVCGFGEETELLEAAEGEDPTVHDLWTSISKLAQIKDISFISCSAAREKALTKLPTTLERLELSNCHEVNSDVLAHYLISGGLHLKELVLHHNPALDLAFLPGLKAQCPRLEELQMTFNFFSELQATNDAEPLYDELLQADEIPQWPSSMRAIDLQHMQKWKAAGAVNLFQSLVDSAAELPDLRYIVLHSHINTSWRDRTSFREQWIGRLERVFKRRDIPPSPHNGSKRQYRLWKEAQQKTKAFIESVASMAAPPQVEPVANSSASSRRRSQRVASTSVNIPIEVDSSDGDAGPSEDQSFVQGRCDVVDIRIDNQRPRENQFTEQDFLDTEASGDEDWNEDAEEAGDDGYAW